MHGILLLDKPIGITSNAALQQVKRLFKIKKAGHTGSLDPIATGMLPICVGEATKFSQFLLDSDKHYAVTAKLGIKTSTGDTEGEVIAQASTSAITQNAITSALSHFLGESQQIPPMYSAIKHKGTPLYKLARQGIEIERAPRTIFIRSLELTDYAADTATFKINVHCSKGTYIRTLVEDIGEKLGCCAHVTGLRRIAVAPYRGAMMYTFEDLNKSSLQNKLISNFLLSIDTALQDLPAVKLDNAMTYYFRMGQPVMIPKLNAKGPIKILSDQNEFLGVGEQTEDGRIAPKRLVARRRSE